MKIKLYVMWVGCLLTIAGGTLASEQGSDFDLGTTTVTAQKVEQDEADVPVSLTVIDGQRAVAAGTDSPRDASLFVPNVLVLEPGPVNFGGIFVRGVGSAARGDNSVAMYLDGVPQFDSATVIRRINSRNIDRYEFLRGPQATLYGRNTLGGVINVVTPPPAETPTAYLSAGGGNFSRVEMEAGFSGMITDTFGMTIDGRFMRRDSYFENTFPGNSSPDEEEIGGRAKFVYAPDDRFEATVTLWAEQREGTGFIFAPIAQLDAMPHTYTHDFQSSESREIFGGAVKLTYDFGGIAATSVTSIQSYDAENLFDRDFTALDINVQDSDIEELQFTEEIRLNSTDPVILGEDVELAWLAGLYIGVVDNEERFIDSFGTAAGMLAGLTRTRNNAEDQLNVGVFGQVTLTLWEDLDLVGGLRYEYDRREIDTSESSAFFGFPVPGSAMSADFDRSDGEWLPTFAINWRACAWATIFGRVAKGYRGGGFNDDPALPRFEYEPETLWSFEVGAKTTWLDGRLRANASVFYIDHEDIQLLLFDPAVGTFTIRNAGEARTYGAELEIVALPLGTEQLEVFGSVGWLDAEFDDFNDPVGGSDATGNDVPFAPEYTWNLGVRGEQQLSEGLKVFGLASVTGYGPQAFTPDNTITENSYEIVSLRAGLGGANWRVEAWVNNALDEEYLMNGFVGFGGAGFGSNGPPRAYGVTVTIKY